MPAQTFSLVYISRAVMINPQELEVRRGNSELAMIQKKALAKNRLLDIRGVLLYVDGNFIQWLEGDEETLRGLLENIRADPRHTDVRVVLEQYRPPALEDWSMSLITHGGSRDSVRAQLDRLISERMGTLTPEIILRSILKPNSPRKTRRRIGLFGQTGLWSGAVLAAMATRWGASVRRTRIVGPDGTEREALLEYVDHDLPAPMGPIRLVNLSGDVLGLDWMTGVVEEVHLAVLLYSLEDADDANAFSRRVSLHLANTPTCKVMALFGRTAAKSMDEESLRLQATGREVVLESMSLSATDSIWQAIEREMPALAVAPAPEVKPSPPPASVPVADLPTAPKAVETPTPESAQTPVAMPTQVAAAGAAWLQTLLALDGVQAAALQNGSIGHPMALLNGGSPELERQVFALMASETAAQAMLAKAFAQHQSGGVQEMLTKHSDGMTLSASLPSHPGAVVMCRYKSSFLNEAMAIRGLQTALARIPGDLFEPRDRFDAVER